MENNTEIATGFISKLEQITSLSSLEQLETEYLGRNGIINAQLQKIKDVEPSQKKEFGQHVNELKKEITEKIISKKSELIAKAESEIEIDVTLPGTPYPKGSLHLITHAIEEIAGIFEKIGFIRMSYPEVEWEFFSFEALNMPADHPARDDFETFFVEQKAHETYGRMVLTPHTSSGQPREMMRLGKPPIRMINIGKTYRPNWDASHVPMFHQFEGLCIDRDINITHLKGTIDYFAKQFFGENREIRLRPFHFQFTEPSFEVDITCGVCNGTGYLTASDSNVISKEERLSNLSHPLEMKHNNDKIKCKLCKSGWLELGGTGMVHPNVLKAGGIDPNEYTGWAFGFGVERVFMMKEGLNLDDIRVMYSGDIRFLEQF
ncbi:MAG TPA: phenylalanine--tRNA ligase subunit alpha [Candidatus Woesebacteria bacterium]|nr:phenylalanine--tRNA ligase subunit alpha [Candidatus Woesebacteria bacterium]